MWIIIISTPEPEQTRSWSVWSQRWPDNRFHRSVIPSANCEEWFLKNNVVQKVVCGDQELAEHNVIEFLTPCHWVVAFSSVHIGALELVRRLIPRGWACRQISDLQPVADPFLDELDLVEGHVCRVLGALDAHWLLPLVFRVRLADGDGPWVSICHADSGGGRSCWAPCLI